MNSRSFPSIEAMSEHQARRALEEAARVQSLSPSERYAWLKENWGRLQDSGSRLYAKMPSQAPSARSFATMEEKNQFDAQREIQFALQYRKSISA